MERSKRGRAGDGAQHIDEIWTSIEFYRDSTEWNRPFLRERAWRAPYLSFPLTRQLTELAGVFVVGVQVWDDTRDFPNMQA